MAEVKNLVIIVNSGADKPYNQYHAYVAAFMAKQMARFVKDKFGVFIASCGMYHVMDGFAKTIDDMSNIEDFILPLRLEQGIKGALAADKMVYY